MTACPPAAISGRRVAGWSVLVDLDRRRGEVVRRLTGGPGGFVPVFASQAGEPDDAG
jgi:hypothetical protein